MTAWTVRMVVIQWRTWTDRLDEDEKGALMRNDSFDGDEQGLRDSLDNPELLGDQELEDEEDSLDEDEQGARTAWTIQSYLAIQSLLKYKMFGMVALLKWGYSIKLSFSKEIVYDVEAHGDPRNCAVMLHWDGYRGSKIVHDPYAVIEAQSGQRRARNYLEGLPVIFEAYNRRPGADVCGIDANFNYQNDFGGNFRFIEVHKDKAISNTPSAHHISLQGASSVLLQPVNNLAFKLPVTEGEYFGFYSHSTVFSDVLDEYTPSLHNVEENDEDEVCSPLNINMKVELSETKLETNEVSGVKTMVSKLGLPRASKGMIYALIVLDFLHLLARLS
ncbi:hypothetical protein SELMODRAFT_416014 [Selaginella moellendorffii]|uniref:Uncharacterized protein n=1 Tax=Selaginella moellendorffii TaxID=88036 RepID=D8RXT3_SELML|nr:hypothetical protein SELMODRAFT_416014 [Selaginella moellendorffii]